MAAVSANKKLWTEAYGPVGKELFIRKAVSWASGFDGFCLLNSNGLSIANERELKVNTNGEEKSKELPDAVLAVGIRKEVFPEKNVLEDLNAFLENLSENAYGFISYELKNEIENLETRVQATIHFPKLWFFIPHIEVFFYESSFTISMDDLDKTTLEKNILSPAISELAALIRIQQPLALDEIKEANYQKDSPANPIKIKNRESRATYLNKINAIKKHISLGNIYEMNFCQEFYAEALKLNPIETYIKLNRISPAPFSVLIKYYNKYVLSSSMERFIEKSGTKLISQPIKGTIARGSTKQEDELNKHLLLNSEKERAENLMIVDLVRNDLSRVATKGSVKVEELCVIHTFPQVHQLISTISAQVKREKTIPAILKYLFPMGSMTGAPKVKAMQLIDRYEQTGRGLFSGSAGWIHANGDFDLNVLIRTIFYDADQQYLSFSTGSAITSLSDPEQEYEECLLKAAGIMKALGVSKSE